MNLTRRDFILSGSAMAIAAATQADASVIELGGRAFGSYWRALVPAQADSAIANRVIQEVVLVVDACMSPWRSDSEVSKFNAHPSTDWYSISQEISVVVDQCRAVARLTDGAFDPTIGPVVARYGFGPIKGKAGSWREIEVDGDRIRKKRAELTLDFCGIAKGYALDLIARALAESGIADALIELGGEVRALGEHPEGRAWQIGIERPFGFGLEFQRIVAPGDLSLATSGTLAQGVESDGHMTTHIIDPATRRPIASNLVQVSVLADTGMRADCLATALSVMGHIAGAKLAERENIAVLFLTRNADGSLDETMTSLFARYTIA